MSAAAVISKTCPDGRLVFGYDYPGAPDPCASGNWVDPFNPEGQGGDVITLQPVITQGTATTGVGGLDPMAPGGPGLSRTWSEAVLAFLFGDDSAAADAPRSAMNATAPGCCAGDPEPHCLKCWLNRHRAWLLIVVLAVAAYLIKRKAAA